MGLRYNDKTGNFEEEKTLRGYSDTRNNSHQNYTQRTSSSNSYSSSSNNSDGCMNFIGKFLLLVLGCVAFFACCGACIGGMSSFDTSKSTNSSPTYQNSNSVSTDFSIGGESSNSSSSSNSYSNEPSKAESTYRVEENEVTCSTCNGSGLIVCQYCHGTGTDTTPHSCTQCGGRGYTYTQCILCGVYGDEVCKNCGGTGKNKVECIYCGGSGTIKSGICHHCDIMKGYKQQCPTCCGSGVVKKQRIVYN